MKHISTWSMLTMLIYWVKTMYHKEIHRSSVRR